MCVYITIDNMLCIIPQIVPGFRVRIIPVLFFFDNCNKIYYPQQEAAKMVTELRSTWSRAWNKVQMGPQ